MIKNGKCNIYGLLFYLIAFVIVAPQYIYVVGGINIVNALAAFTLVAYVALFKVIYEKRISGAIVAIWLFYIVCDIQRLLTAGFLQFVTYLILFIIIPYLIYSVLDSEDKFIAVIDTVIKVGMLLGIYGIIESVTKFNFLQQFIRGDQEVFHEIRYGLLRIMGTFGHPIGYGLFHVFIVALVLYRLSMYQSGKGFLKIAYVISMLNVFLTVSRIPILATVALHMLLLTQISKKKAVNYFVFGLIGVFFVTVVMSAFNIKIPLLDDLVQTVLLLVDGGLGSNTTSSTVGVGSRFDLWLWVTVSMSGHWITGYGDSAQFAYKVYDWATKTSIENQYLNVLYYNGLIGVVSMLVSFLTILKETRIIKGKLQCEGAISFNGISFILMAIYYVCLLGTQESDMTRIYVLYITLIVSYNDLLRRSRHE